MRIIRCPPPVPRPPPVEIQITCNRDEARVLWAALNYWNTGHPHAANRQEWMEWAKQIEKECGGL